MTIITSRANAQIKAIRALHQRKVREERGLYLVEGLHPVGEAVEAGAEIVAIYYAPELLNSEFGYSLIQSQSKSGILCSATSAQVFQTIASKENPQGILAVLKQNFHRIENLSPQNFPWGVALVSPQDPGNLGSILRTIDGAGASGIILIDGGVDPFHPVAVRASMGALFWRPLVAISGQDFQQWAKFHQYHMYGTSAPAQMQYDQIQSYEPPCLLLMGSEREGLSAQYLELCEQVLKIPMCGRSSSLNLSVAAGIMLYYMRSHGCG